ncbi:hypothetical protein L249_0825 [Ophiocordyceps polyrhachis-furcata BCC 54312]|uniref:BTB domain-containing protein n=1 Tax=Ophiocordyceps polyrhachis-furcata BCC 54312 TaxID=1330021 RepID=A0A367LG51_9HYPO|nr:hypothetical protein L249_0825 [Ophiocordyceps polyrhachis-furcata BCC 54312]
MVLPKHELEGKLGEERLMIKNGLLRDENPLDQSAEFKDFLAACRCGDLRRCQELINQGVNINGKDDFDYTPLIIASLCGHYELVQLLLDSGALAERNTFQGERCIYNALNDRIRNLLLRYDFSKSANPYVYWSAHLSSLLSRTKPATSDMCLVAGSRSFRLHKFLLVARTPYFRAKFGAQPETTSWKVDAAVPLEAVHIALRYLYLDEVPTDLVPPDRSSSVSEDEVARGLIKISKQLGVERLWDAVVACSDRRLVRQRYRDEEERALKQVGDFFRDRVLGGKVVVDADGVRDFRLGPDNAAFADVLLCANEPPLSDGDGDENGAASLLDSQGILPPGPRPRRKSVLYPCHKAMLIRSDYFSTMFSGDFIEAQTTDHLRVVTVDCTPAVLELVLSFLYTESFTCPLEHALDLLYTADMLFLDSLKNKAAMMISTLGSESALVDRAHGVGDGGEEKELINIYDVIHAAWTLRLQRLEEFAARYLAGRLEDYIDDAEFHELIRESAGRIRRREETDSIELLDDIRYYLSERFRLRFEDAGLDGIMSGGGGGGDKGGAPLTDAPPPLGGGALSGTVDGDGVEDEFASEAINYRALLGRIDDMLDLLGLDA